MIVGNFPMVVPLFWDVGVSEDKLLLRKGEQAITEIGSLEGAWIRTPDCSAQVLGSGSHQSVSHALYR